MRELPPYARPLFLRLRGSLDITATFKQRKDELVREGFDPTATEDAIYFDDPETKAYIPLDAALFTRIGAGDVRV